MSEDITPDVSGAAPSADFIPREPAELPAELSGELSGSEPAVNEPSVGEIPAEGQTQAAVSSAVEEDFTNAVIAALKSVYDPEIPVDIYELGLIYLIDISESRDVIIDMTLTAPGCPIAGEMPVMVETAVRTVEGVGDVTVNMTFDPPWTPERMSEEARVSLNMF